MKWLQAMGVLGEAKARFVPPLKIHQLPLLNSLNALTPFSTHLLT
jgi:hypothetical protein